MSEQRVSREQIDKAMVGFVNHERDIGYCLTEFLSRLDIKVSPLRSRTSDKDTKKNGI